MAAFVQLLCMCDNLKAVNPQNFIHDISVFYLLTVFFIFKFWSYGTTVLYCVMILIFIFTFPPTHEN